MAGGKIVNLVFFFFLSGEMKGRSTYCVHSVVGMFSRSIYTPMASPPCEDVDAVSWIEGLKIPRCKCHNGTFYLPSVSPFSRRILCKTYSLYELPCAAPVFLVERTPPCRPISPDDHNSPTGRNSRIYCLTTSDAHL